MDGGPAEDARIDDGRNYVLAFAIRGRARYLGHLDTTELLRRAVRRAGGRLAVSGGMRPKPLLSLALARGVGVSSRKELAEFRLAEEPPAEFAARLQTALPEGFLLLSLAAQTKKAGLASRVRAVRYCVSADPAGQDPAVFVRAADGYTVLESVPIERDRIGKRRLVNVREYVERIDVEPAGQGLVLEYTAAVTPRGSVRPEEVVLALAQLAGVPLRMTGAERVDILLEEQRAA
jgi:radical SAM-linked protein